MRSTSLLFMLLCGLAFSGWAQAQTWTSPLVFNTDTYVSEGNNCYQQREQLTILDTGDQIFGPVVVYRAEHRPAFPSKLNRPWSVQLLPQYGFLDFSIWVCANHFGNQLSNCPDGSDNGPGVVNNVVAPGYYSTSWYVVVAGSIYNQSQCGPFTLVARKL
jgi:hypothetical protein